MFVVLSGCEGPAGPQGQQGEQGEKGDSGADGSVITIGSDGYWYIDGVTTGKKALGEDGSIVTIGDNGNWFIDGVDTDKKAQGEKGDSGTDGSVITIGLDGYWYIDGVTTGKKALGEDGSVVTIGDNGNWFIDGVDTDKKAQGPKGDPGDLVIADGIDYITVTGPTKTGYFQGDPFNTAGLVVTAHYEDNSVVTVNSGYSLSWNDQTITSGNYDITAALGSETVTVDWRGKTASFIIMTVAPSSILVTNTSEWNAALSLISNGGNNLGYTINVIGDVAVPGSTSNTFGSVTGLSVTLKGNGKLYLTSQGSMLRVAEYQTLYIDSEDLVLEGLTNGQNGVSQNNTEALVYMTGNAKIELRNGTISGNTINLYGGGSGVYVGDNSSFIMSGGTISGNTINLYGDGGGVLVNSGSFTMSGGTISRNSSQFGGGVEVVYSGSFTMSGGTISGNSSSSAGGGVFCRNTGIFRITNGIVYGNTAEPAELRNTAYSGAALQSESDTAQHGTFNTEGEWQSAGDLTTTDDTIEVIDGVLQN